MNEASADTTRPAEQDRGDLLGKTANKIKVFDAPNGKSHLDRHPEVRVLLEQALSRVVWDDTTPEGQSISFSVKIEGANLGQAQVVSVPEGPNIKIVYAPRLGADGKPFQQPGQNQGDLLFSRCVMGLPQADIPVCDKIKVVLSRPAGLPQADYWLRLATAYPFAGDDATREAGIKFTSRAKFDKNPALRYWEGINPLGERVDNGHAFVWDPMKFDVGNVRDECPYDLNPYREPDPTIS